MRGWQYSKRPCAQVDVSAVVASLSEGVPQTKCLSVYLYPACLIFSPHSFPSGGNLGQGTQLSYASPRQVGCMHVCSQILILILHTSPRRAI